MREEAGVCMGRDERQKGKSEARIKISKIMRTKRDFLSVISVKGGLRVSFILILSRFLSPPPPLPLLPASCHRLCTFFDKCFYFENRAAPPVCLLSSLSIILTRPLSLSLSLSFSLPALPTPTSTLIPLSLSIPLPL